MQIDHQNEQRIVFQPVSPRERVVGSAMTAGFLAFGMTFLYTASDRATKSLQQLTSSQAVSASTTELLALLGFLVFGLVFAYLGSQLWFVALPFRLELARAPAAMSYVWGPYRVKQEPLDPPTAVVAVPGWRKHSWPFTLYVRTPHGEKLLLSSHQTWPTELEAKEAASELGEHIADYLGCPLVLERWH